MLLGVDLAWTWDPDLQTEFTTSSSRSNDNERVSEQVNGERVNKPTTGLFELSKV